MLGFTYDFLNPSTQYQNGVDMHLDWSASQFLTKKFMLGLVGYVYKGSVAIAAPAIGWTTPLLVDHRACLIGVGFSAGEIASVTHAFHPEGRFSAANSP